jgi:hypothetical protein
VFSRMVSSAVSKLGNCRMSLASQLTELLLYTFVAMRCAKIPLGCSP